MALSSCPKCSAHRFEMKEVEPAGGTYKQIFIQCASCGTVVGVTGYFDAGEIAHQNRERLKTLEAAVAQLDHQLRQIAQRLR